DQLLADLKRYFDRSFEEAEKGIHYHEKTVRSSRDAASKVAPEQHRAQIANLLFNLVEVMPPQQQAQGQPVPVWQDPAYKRFLWVVGLEQAAKALEVQGQKLNRIGLEERQEIESDRKLFAIIHTDMVRQIRERAATVAEKTDELQRVKTEADERGKLVTRRKEDVRIWQEQLDMARQDTEERVKELRARTDELYKIRVKVRDSTQLNQEYESEIRKLERRVGRP